MHSVKYFVTNVQWIEKANIIPWIVYIHYHFQQYMCFARYYDFVPELKHIPCHFHASLLNNADAHAQIECAE